MHQNTQAVDRELAATAIAPTADAPYQPAVRPVTPSEARKPDLDNRFSYHAPKDDQPVRYNAIRAHARVFADDIVRLTPVSREQSMALTHLEEAVMWANAAIARNE